MKDITSAFYDDYQPSQILVFYENKLSDEPQHYTELFDVDTGGLPVNARAITENESARLGKILLMGGQSASSMSFVESRGIIPESILHIAVFPDPVVIWQTPAMRERIIFSDHLPVKSGHVFVPPLLWKATSKNLSLWALTDNKRASLDTKLYHAPFFNLWENGSVCMGTVRIDIPRDCCLEEFTSKWQRYFFDSKFDHLLGLDTSTKKNIVQLWQELVNTEKKFPVEHLKQTSLTLKNIL